MGAMLATFDLNEEYSTSEVDGITIILFCKKWIVRELNSILMLFRRACYQGTPTIRTNRRFWKDLNLHLKFRRLLFYPLNYNSGILTRRKTEYLKSKAFTSHWLAIKNWSSQFNLPKGSVAGIEPARENVWWFPWYQYHILTKDAMERIERSTSWLWAKRAANAPHCEADGAGIEPATWCLTDICYCHWATRQ